MMIMIVLMILMIDFVNVLEDSVCEFQILSLGNDFCDVLGQRVVNFIDQIPNIFISQEFMTIKHTVQNRCNQVNIVTELNI